MFNTCGWGFWGWISSVFISILWGLSLVTFTFACVSTEIVEACLRGEVLEEGSSFCSSWSLWKYDVILPEGLVCDSLPWKSGLEDFFFFGWSGSFSPTSTPFPLLWALTITPHKRRNEFTYEWHALSVLRQLVNDS